MPLEGEDDLLVLYETLEGFIDLLESVRFVYYVQFIAVPLVFVSLLDPIETFVLELGHYIWQKSKQGERIIYF